MASKLQSALDKHKETIESFIAGDRLYPRARWIESAYMSIFVRKATRMLNVEGGDGPVKKDTFDLANVSVPQKYQNKGLTRGLLDFLVDLKPCEAIYVENVTNVYLAQTLERRGFKRCLDCGFPSQLVYSYCLIY